MVEKCRCSAMLNKWAIPCTSCRQHCSQWTLNIYMQLYQPVLPRKCSWQTKFISRPAITNIYCCNENLSLHVLGIHLGDRYCFSSCFIFSQITNLQSTIGRHRIRRRRWRRPQICWCGETKPEDVRVWGTGFWHTQVVANYQSLCGLSGVLEGHKTGKAFTIVSYSG